MSFDLQALSDRAALTDLVHRYAIAVDRNDLDGVAACFAVDATADYAGGTHLEGREAIRAFLADALKDGVGAGNPSSHLMTNIMIDLDGDSASIVTTAVACLTRSTDKVAVRGLRYTDQCIRDGDRWRFRHRRHEADWAFEADCLFVTRWTGSN